MTKIKKNKAIKNYHGTKIADPFSYLENSNDPDTKMFIEKQNLQTRNFLDQFKESKEYKERIKELWDYEKFSVPQKYSEYFYYQYNDGLRKQPILLRTDDLTKSPEKCQVIIDLNEIDSSGQTSLANYSVSPDGNYLVYGLSISGSDWLLIKVKDLKSQKDLSDEVMWCKFTSLPWLPDSTGFFYSRYPNPETDNEEDSSKNNKVYLHKLNTSQEEDILIKEDANPDRNFRPWISDDGTYNILYVSEALTTGNYIYYKELESKGDFIPLIEVKDSMTQFLGNVDNIFYFLTNYQAPKRRIISIDINNPKEENWKTIIEEGQDVITQVSMSKSNFAVIFMHNAHHNLCIYNLSGDLINKVELPSLGAINELKADKDKDSFYFDFASFLYPNSVFRFDAEEGLAKLIYSPHVDFDFENYKTYQVFYKSKDGTQVPMFITHDKDLKLDGNNKAYLYSYGGFNVPRIPEFKASDLAWLEKGNIFAVANLRGGSEYGEEWHKAGMLENKQNVFDDFIGAAEYLIEEGYTNNKKLAIKGRSNGGLLTAACMLQRPDLYGAVVSQVPVMDMFKYHKFTDGRFWVPEYGNAEENPDHFKFLYEYSPLHNIRFATVYPPILITTAKTDDRVVPMHSYKFAASMQEISFGDNPILLRVDFGAGHGEGKSTNLLIDEEADIYTFIDTMLNND